MVMADTDDSEITWISLKEMQQKKFCRHCNKPMDMKQINLSEACRICSEDECPIPFTDIPEIEYIQHSYRYLNSSCNNIPEAAMELVSFEEEMQRINNLFTEIEGMLSSKVYEQYKRELSEVCSRNQVSKRPAFTHSLQESMHPEQDYGRVSLNSGSMMLKSEDSAMSQLEQQLNITDQTSHSLHNLNLRDEQCIDSSGRINSQDTTSVEDQSKLSSSFIDNSIFNAEGRISNDVTLVTDPSHHDSCTETLLSTLELKNYEILSTTDFEAIFGPNYMSQENMDENAASSSGSLTNWLDSIVEYNEERSLQNSDVALKPLQSSRETAVPLDDKSSVHTMEEHEVKVEDANMGGNLSHNAEEVSKSSTKQLSFPKEKMTPFKCYRPSRKHQQQLCRKEKERENAEMVTDLPQAGTSSDLVTLTSPPVNFCLFGSYSDKNETSSSEASKQSDEEEICEVEVGEGDPYELFGDVTSDTHKYCGTPPPDLVFAMSSPPQEEELVEKVEQLVERQDETYSDLKERIIEEDHEKIKVLMESCCIMKKQDDKIPDSIGGVTVTSREGMEVEGRVCTRASKVLSGKTSLKVSSKDQIKQKIVKGQRKRQPSKKNACDKMKIIKENSLSDQKISMNTAENCKLNKKSSLGFSELSYFEGAKCSFSSKKNKCKRVPIKKINKIDTDELSNASAEIENAIANVQMFSSHDSSSLEELLQILS